jgi:hypothetical protein
MSVQLQTSFSSSIYGVAALAGGPFWCAQDQVALALTECMKDGDLIVVSELALIMVNTAATGFIDPLKNLARTRLWLFSAQQDTEVELPVVKKAEALYAEFQMDPASQTQAIYSQPGVHGQLIVNPVPNVSNPCLVFGSPYINSCGFDAAGSALQWLYYGQLTPPAPAIRSFYAQMAPPAWTAHSNADKRASEPLRGAAGSLYEFDQVGLEGGAMYCSCSLHCSHGKATSLIAFDSQTLFVDGKVWSDVFGLAAVSEGV